MWPDCTKLESKGEDEAVYNQLGQGKPAEFYYNVNGKLSENCKWRMVSNFRFELITLSFVWLMDFR